MPTAYELAKQGKITWEGQQQGQPAQVAQPAQEPTQPVSPAAPSYQEQLTKMTNYDKLSGFEKWVYGWMPSFAGKIGEISTTVSGQLEKSWVGRQTKFGLSWAGKLLTGLDILAEGLERTVGTFVQAVDAASKNEMDKFDLQDAWYAGSLAADVGWLPEIKRDANGKVIGLQLPTDLPGLDGLAEARQKIAAGVPLEQVRDEYYNSLGALALRAQMQDMFFHIAGDPLNLVTGFLKPVEKIAKTRFLAVTSKISNIGDLGKELDLLKDLQKTTTDAAELTKIAGRITDVEGAMAKVSAGTYKTYNTVDKIAIFLTGGDPLAPRTNKFLNVVLKPFELTPESKARELITLLEDNVGSMCVRANYFNPNAEEEITKAVMRFAAGSRGPEFGAAVWSLEGRTAQAFAAGTATEVERRYLSYMAVKRERVLLGELAEMLQSNPKDIMKLAEKDSAALMRNITNVVTDMTKQGLTPPPGVAAMLASQSLQAETLEGLKNILVKGIPYNKEWYVVDIMDAISEHAMRQATVQFGVKNAKGLLTRWSNSMRAAETLAFIRMNPMNFFRNVINNEMTMLARGVFGTMTAGQQDNFWKLMGNVPMRLKQGFGLAGEAEMVARGADKILMEALRSDVKGAPEAIQKFFRNINLGKADFSKMSAQFESAASKRAMTTSYVHFYDQYYKPLEMSKVLDGATMDAMRSIIPDIESKMAGIQKSSMGRAGIMQEFLNGNLNINVGSVVEEIGKKHNLSSAQVAEILGDETMTALHTGLVDAMKNGKVEQFLFNLQETRKAHLMEAYRTGLDNLTNEVMARTTAQGPKAFYSELANAQDDWLSYEISHTLRNSDVADLAREAAKGGDFGAAHALWKKVHADEQEFFARAEKVHNARYAGLKKAQQELAGQGTKLPNVEELETVFKETRGRWKSFFSERNKDLDSFFDARYEGKEYKLNYDQIMDKYDAKYRDLVAMEDDAARRMDDIVAQSIPDPKMRKGFLAWRDEVARVRAEDKAGIIDMHKELRNAEDGVPRQQIYDRWAAKHLQNLETQKNLEKYGDAMMQGDDVTAQMFQMPPAAGVTEAGQFNISTLADELGIPTQGASGVRMDKRIKNIIEKNSEFKFAEGQTIYDVPENIARDAFRKWQIEHEVMPKKAAPFIQRFDDIVPPSRPDYLGLDETMRMQSKYLDEIVGAAKQQVDMKPALVKDLPPELQQKFQGFVERMTADQNDANLAATRFAEWGRDSALLNYNRKINFDAWAAHVFPFSFWTTASIMKWAIHSIDRPAMLTTYLRFKKFLDTAGMPESGFPSRFRGHIRVKLPFAPEWMGDQFIDPLRVLLPFDGFAQPVEQMMQNKLTVQGRAERVLEGWKDDGTISEDEFNDAMTHQGAGWDRAVSEAQTNDDSLKFDPWDFATLMTSPHAPLAWAYNVATGHPENIGPFTPASRTIKNLATTAGNVMGGVPALKGVAQTLGLDDWNNSPINIEGQIRKKMGLPAFDKLDDYRTDRMLSSMTGTGEYSVDEVKEAMVISGMVQQGKMTPEQAKQQSPIYAEAIRRANIEYSGGAPGTLMTLFALPVGSYPEGERNLRIMQDELNDAYTRYYAVDEAAQKYIDAHPNMDQEAALAQFMKENPKLSEDAEAVTRFYDRHPEYETRLALWKKPEERLQQFMIDQVWSAWNQMPTLWKNEAKEQLGVDFEQQFLTKETRSYDSLTPERMAVWLKLMGGNPIGTLKASTAAIGRLRLASKDVAYRVQTFYNMRKEIAPEFYQMQQDYFALSKSERKAYLSKNPSLKQYWDWRRDYMLRNPDVAPYLTDTPPSPSEYAAAAQAPKFTWQEWATVVSPSVQQLVLEFYQQGEPLPDAAREQLDYLADLYNVQGGGDAMLALMGQSLGQ